MADTDQSKNIKYYNDDCMICLDTIQLNKTPIDYDIVILECKHAYHYHCFLQWIIDSKQAHKYKINCPLCNQLTGIKSIYYPALKL